MAGYSTEGDKKNQQMSENDIRPKEIFDEYLSLAKEDTKKYFTNCENEYFTCPACGREGEKAFTKESFNYDECKDCKTLFVNPRPLKKYFDEYYLDSASTKFWATTFYAKTEKARREKIWLPKAKIISDKMEELGIDGHSIVDIGAGYGIFCEEISKISKSDIYAIEPSKYLAKILREKKIVVIENFLENVTKSDLPVGKKCFTSFELFEHLYDPFQFLKILSNVMSIGDIFIFTTLSGIGVDIQVLWEKSKAIHPPHHLNFLNPSSINILLKRVGLVSLEITTPGRLDIDIMLNNINDINDRFWRTFLQISSKDDKEKMQQFLSKNLLSSYMMIICKKI